MREADAGVGALPRWGFPVPRSPHWPRRRPAVVHRWDRDPPSGPSGPESTGARLPSRWVFR